MPLATQFRATPPARQSFFSPVSRCTIVQQLEVALLEHGLHGRGQVAMLLLDLAAGYARRAEDLDHLCGVDAPDGGLATVPGHLDAVGVMDEVVEIEPDLVVRRLRTTSRTWATNRGSPYAERPIILYSSPYFGKPRNWVKAV